MTEATPVPAPEANAAAPTGDRPALPDHLSIDPRSRFYNAAVFEHEVGIRVCSTRKHIQVKRLKMHHIL